MAEEGTPGLLSAGNGLSQKGILHSSFVLISIVMVKDADLRINSKHAYPVATHKR